MAPPSTLVMMPSAAVPLPPGVEKVTGSPALYPEPGLVILTQPTSPAPNNWAPRPETAGSVMDEITCNVISPVSDPPLMAENASVRLA